MKALPWILIVLLAPLAAAGSADAPEVTDAAGDCALPYGNEYLDIVSVWIDGERNTSFLVNIALAGFDAMLAEGAGYAAQFSHQGVRWGVVVVGRPATDGWAYYTGVMDDTGLDASTLESTSGEFVAGDAPALRIEFPKALFPHTDPTDPALSGFWASSADLRPAYPFLLGTDRVSPGSSNGRWLVCDEAASDATYTFRIGQLSLDDDAAGLDAASEASGSPSRLRATPIPAWITLVGLAAGLRMARR